MYKRKKLFALLAAVMMSVTLLTSCVGKPAENDVDPFAGLDFSDVGTSPTSTDDKDDVSLPDEFPYNIEWGGQAALESPYYKEYSAMDTAERDQYEYDLKRGYVESLGLAEYFDAYTSVYNYAGGTTKIYAPGSFGMSFSADGNYFKYDYSFDTPGFIAAVIDTNAEGPCYVSVSYTEINPITGEERSGVQRIENGDGECGLRALFLPDEGFYFNGCSIGKYLFGKLCGGEVRDISEYGQFLGEVQHYLNQKSEIEGTPVVNLRHDILEHEYPDKDIIVWVYDSLYGSVSEKAQNAVNEYLSELGRDYVVCFSSMRADYNAPVGEDYRYVLKDRISKGTQYDIVSTGAVVAATTVNTASSYHRYVFDGIYEPLGDMLKNTDIGREYAESVPENYLKMFDVDGEIYGIGGGNTVISPGLGYCVNRELADKYGWDINKPVEEQLDILKAVSENEKNCATVVTEAQHLYALYYPNSVSNVLAAYYDSESDSIRRVTEDPELQEYARLMSALSAAGLENEFHKIGPNGYKDTFFICIDGCYEPYEFGETATVTRALVCTADVICAYSSPRIRCADRATGISSASNHKDKAFDFLMLSQLDAYINNILNCGIEGEDYELTDGVVKQALSTKNFTNIFIAHPINDESADFAAHARKLFETAEVPATAGFAFDAEPVAEEYNRLREIINERNFYVDDYDDAIAEFDEKLDEAGFDRVLEEINSQYKKWKENKQ